MIDTPIGLLQTSRVSPQELSRTGFDKQKKGDDDHWSAIICSTVYAPQRNCRSYFQIKVASPSLFSKPVTPKLTPRASAWRLESHKNIASCFFSQMSIPDTFPVNQPFFPFQRCQVFKELVHHLYWCLKFTIQYIAIQSLVSYGIEWYHIILRYIKLHSILLYHIAWHYMLPHFFYTNNTLYSWLR